jgi:hypothetical protein
MAFIYLSPRKVHLQTRGFSLKFVIPLKDRYLMVVPGAMNVVSKMRSIQYSRDFHIIVCPAQNCNPLEYR